MSNLHPNITYQTPEALIGDIIHDALNVKLEIAIKSFTHLEVVLLLKNSEEAKRFNNYLNLNYNLAPFITTINEIKNKEALKQIEMIFQTSLNTFDKYNTYLSTEYYVFDKIIEKVSKEINPSSKEEIDEFLVEIGFLNKRDPNDSADMQREWDIEYNKIVLALKYFRSLNRFILFSKYVYKTIATLNFSRENAELIWNNKSLWIKRFF